MTAALVTRSRPRNQRLRQCDERRLWQVARMDLGQRLAKALGAEVLVDPARAVAFDGPVTTIAWRVSVTEREWRGSCNPPDEELMNAENWPITICTVTRKTRLDWSFV